MNLVTHKKYTIAIVAMTYNQPALIEALYKELNPFLEVLDNGSTMPIPYSHLQVPENRYFAGGWNYAMPYIEGDWVAMLNDDITGISWQMIMDLVEEAEANHYAAISPAFNSPHDWSQPHDRGLHTVPAIDWVATIIRKDAWNAVGGFNAEAFPGYGCDLDIAHRLRQSGYRLAVDDRHVIHHLGGTAAIAAGTQGIQGNVTSMNESFQKLYGVSDWAEFVSRFLL